MNKLIFFFILFCPVFLNSSCDKEAEIPPTIEFKTGGGYTSSDAMVSPDSVLIVGIIAQKTEDDLNSYNVSVSYDGALTTNTIQDYTISESDRSHYEKDVTIPVRSTSGTEKYYFTITDSDRNIAQLTLVITVE